MAYLSAGDWRSPGQKWVRTETGWQPCTDVCPGHTSKQCLGVGDGAWGESAGPGPGRAGPVPDSTSLRAASTSDVDRTGARGTEQSRDVLPSGVSGSKSVCTSSGDLHEEAKPELQRETSAEPTSPRAVLGPQPSGYTTTEAAQVCRARQRLVEQRQEKERQLMPVLQNCCVSSYTSSRESSNYATLSVSVTKLKFLEALHSSEYLPYICKVSALMFHHYTSMSGSLQALLMKICQRAQQITLETGDHLDTVAYVLNTAVTSLDSAASKKPYNLKTLQNRCTDLRRMLSAVEQVQSELRGDVELSSLPVDCLRVVISHLTHPQDLVSLSSTCHLLHSLTEEQWIWKALLTYHIGKTKVMTLEENWRAESYGLPLEWKEQFIMEYSCSLRHTLSTRPHSPAISLCTVCSKVFWHRHGHPCTAAETSNEVIESVPPDMFLTLFPW